VLLDHFAAIFAAHYDRPAVVIRPQVRQLLLSYPWPGNVRELATWVERLYVTGLDPEALIDMLLNDSGVQAVPVSGEAMSLRQAERSAIVQALEHSNFNQRKAARMLQVHRATLARKLKRHRLV
jgi:DNA-binding NtrC family response regulator